MQHFTRVALRIRNIGIFVRRWQTTALARVVLIVRLHSRTSVCAMERDCDNRLVLFSAGSAGSTSNAVALAAGGLSGLLADSLVHPIDTVRSRLQVQRGTGPNLLYRTTFGSARHIVTTEGARALYKGFGSVAFFTLPAHGMYFAGYEYAKRHLRFGAEESPLSHFGAGIVADLSGALLWCPQDVIKQKMQVQENRRGEQRRYHNSFHAFRSVLSEEGVRGLYRGYVAALMVYAPMVGMHFMLYEAIKAKLAVWLHRLPKELPPALYLGAAMVSASTSAYGTTPLDVVKTRLQVQSAAEGGYRGIWHGVTTIAREEGLRAFFKGSGARMLWLGPNAALGMLFYEQLTKLMTAHV